MNDDNKSIHEFDFELICEYFSRLERQGPGNPEVTIYTIGFVRGINEWRKFLKPGGHLAVSEASWFAEERPVEIDANWNDAYPEIDTIACKLQQLQTAG